MSALNGKIKDRDPDDPSFAQPKRPSTPSPKLPDVRPAQRRMRQVVIAIGVLAVVFAVAVPGFQIAIVLLGGLLAAWGVFGLLTD
ncbi:MAG: hypothetical protein M3364_03520 [Actinomycetota bacterium]|nr:hypothetical protein [Actinomycetota bacterium]